MAMKDDAKSLSFVEDTAVAPEKLRDYIDRFLAIVAQHKTTAGVYAHASVGCLHVRPVINLKTADGVRTFEALANDVADLVLEFGGALSGEHGDGLVRGPFMEKMFGPALYEAFRDIKRTFDPDGIFNPGKIVDAPPLTAQPPLRRRLPHADARRPSSTTPNTAAWPARSRCAAAWARAGRRSTARCARRTWRRGTRRTRRAAARTSCGSRWPVDRTSSTTSPGKSLAGEAQNLKEYTVGLDVFGKPASYDPRQESVVRMHVGRLRQKLTEYYRTEGAGRSGHRGSAEGRFHPDVCAASRRGSGRAGTRRPSRPRRKVSTREIALAASLLLAVVSAGVFRRPAVARREDGGHRRAAAVDAGASAVVGRRCCRRIAR